MAITLTDALQRTIEHREIFHDEMLSLMRRIMSGEVSPVMIAALTVGLRVKKETIGEIAAAAQVMREFATKVEVADQDHLLDVVGTGGDEHRRGRDVERVRGIATGADDVEQGGGIGDVDLGRELAHHLRGRRDLADRFLLDPQTHRQRGDHHR